jgi:hypothetical protein
METPDSNEPPYIPFDGSDHADEPSSAAYEQEGVQPGYDSTGIIPEDIAVTAEDATSAGAEATEPVTDQPAHPALKEVFETLGADPDSAEARALDHLAILPGNEHVIIRMYPAPHHLRGRGGKPGTNPITVEAAHQRVADVRVHHTILAGGGEGMESDVIIPDTFYQVEPTPDGKATIISISERIHGQPFAYDLQQHRTLDPSQQEAALKLAGPVIRYYDWVVHTIPDSFLSDAATPDQYFITENNKLALVDTDPMLRSLTVRGEGWTHLGNNIEQIRSWVSKLSLPEGAEEQRHMLLDQLNTARDRLAELRNSYVYTLPES